MKICLILAFVLAFILALGSLGAQESLKIGTFTGTEAYQRAVGKAFTDAGLSVQFVDLPPLRSLQMVQDGMLDAELIRAEGEEANYPALVRINVPLGEDVVKCYVRRDRGPILEPIIQEEISQPEKKSSLKAVTIRGLRMAYLEAQRFSTIEVVNDWKTAFVLLENQKVDVLLSATHLFAFGSLQSPYNPGRYTSVGPSLKKFKLYFYINKEKQGLIPRLTPLLEKAAQSLPEFFQEPGPGAAF